MGRVGVKTIEKEVGRSCIKTNSLTFGSTDGDKFYIGCTTSSAIGGTSSASLFLDTHEAESLLKALKSFLDCGKEKD